MAINTLKRTICDLFEVHQDEQGVQRVITPLEYPGSNDHIVVRVRPMNNGNGYLIDENGEAAFFASLNGGNIESDAVSRWADKLATISPVKFSDNEIITSCTDDESLIAPYIFRVAEAAQQLYAIATARAERQESDFKERVKSIVEEIAFNMKLECNSEVVLPIAGGLKADHVLGINSPFIIIAATSATRLLEAEVIFLQYRKEQKEGYILAVAESQEAVGKTQYERAVYYTNKAVVFNSNAFGKLIEQEVTTVIH